MKKYFLIIFLVLISSFIVLQIAEAQSYLNEVTKQMQATAGDNGAGFGAPNDPRLVIAYIIKILLSLLGIIMTAYVVYAGFLIMTSSGDEEKTKKGKSIISYGIIGLAVILTSYGIVTLVTNLLKTGEQCTGAFCLQSSVEVQPVMNVINPDPYSERVPGGLPTGGGGTSY